MSALTPFDRGEVLEPKVWSNGFTDRPEDWGLVDFDDDEGTTRATIRVDRGAGGTYVMTIVDQLGDEEHTIRLGGGDAE